MKIMVFILIILMSNTSFSKSEIFDRPIIDAYDQCNRQYGSSSYEKCLDIVKNIYCSDFVLVSDRPETTNCLITGEIEGRISLSSKSILIEGRIAKDIYQCLNEIDQLDDQNVNCQKIYNIPNGPGDSNAGISSTECVIRNF